jgi:hypothetical protein
MAPLSVGNEVVNLSRGDRQVVNEPSTLSIAALAATIDTCELCATPDQTLRAAVTLRQAGGATTSFAACSRCTAALRRVIAVAGGVSAAGPAAFTVSPPPVVEATPDASPDLVGAPTAVLELAERLIGPDGQAYVVRVWGQGRADGTWVGWLSFVSVGGDQVRVTRRETSQSNLAGVRYWATGLQASYVEGAFQRAATR